MVKWKIPNIKKRVTHLNLGLVIVGLTLLLPKLNVNTPSYLAWIGGALLVIAGLSFLFNFPLKK